MIHSAHASHTAGEKPPHHSFLTWITASTAPVVGQFIGLCSVGVLITSLLYYGTHQDQRIKELLTAEGLQLLIFAAHVPFLAFCIFYMVAILGVNDVGAQRVRDTHERIFGMPPMRPADALTGAKMLLGRFKTYFLWFWIIMLALYLSFLIIALIGHKPSEPLTVEVPGHVAYVDLRKPASREGLHDEPLETHDRTVMSTPPKETVVTVQAILLKYEATVKKVEVTATPLGGAQDIYSQMEEFSCHEWWPAFRHVLVDFIPFALNTLSLAPILACQLLLSMSNQSRRERLRQKQVTALSGLSLSALIILYPLLLSVTSRDGVYSNRDLLEYTTMANAISGTLNAIVLALLIARLDSKLIGLPSLLVSFLYFYAAVQPLFVVFAQEGLVNEYIKTFVLLAVFVSKIHFFLIIAFAMQTGRMLNYFYCFPTLNRRANSMFSNLFELRVLRHTAKAYGFLICRGKDTVFSTDREYDSWAACTAAANVALTLMRDPKAYEIRSELGSFTVDVRSKHGVVCSSVDQESHDDADDLVSESVEMVPWCVVRRR